MTKNRIIATCDISLKESLSLDEAICYLGFGNHNIFREWRAKGEIEYYKLGKGNKGITYSRRSLDKLLQRRIQR